MTGRLLSVAALLALAACASVPTPTYRDFEVRTAPAAVADTSLTLRLAAAATAAGWTPEMADGIVTTAPRPVSGGFLSSTTARLDLLPLNAGPAHGPRYVRVIVRAERRSFLGGRTKVYALDGGEQRALLAPISEALAARGLVALGTPRDRDEDATDG